MIPLTVPALSLKFEAAAPGVALLEKPVEVRSAPVRLPDGTVVVREKLSTAGFFLYRQRGGVGAAEVWDEQTKLWKPDPGPALAAGKVKLFAFLESEPASPWMAMVVAAGQTDAAGYPQFQKAVGGFPQYFVRSYFAGDATDGKAEGWSPPSVAFQFISVTDNHRASIALGPDEKPEKATRIRMFLRDPALREIGRIEIHNATGLAEIELSNHQQGGASGARIRLLQNGDVQVEPAPGRNIVLTGPLLAERIFYQPADALTGAATGPKQWLP